MEREGNRWWAGLLLLLFLALPLAWVSQMVWASRFQNASWTELKEKVEQGKVLEVTVDDRFVQAKLAAEGEEPERVVQVVLVKGDESFYPLLDAKDVPYRAVSPSPCSDGTVPLLLIPIVMLGLAWVAISRQGNANRGLAAFGRSSAVVVPEEGTGVTFADVAGVEEAAEELQEIVQFLKTPEKFTSLGGRPPKGALLIGPPGTGKTLLARAVAGEAGVPFFSISGSSFVEMFVGVGAARVRDLFRTATEHAPCIIFIDELDAVGKARGVSGPAGNEEREQTLNQLLVEMDGFDNRKGVIVMAATNRPETLDSALMRPGRFDRQVVVDRPDVRGRQSILEVHAKKLKLSDDVDLHALASETPGFAGADLANILNEAALLAARRDHTSVNRADLSDAVERVVAGLERKNRRLPPEEKRATAYHECGHAIVGAASPGADPVRKISIIPRGLSTLGYTWMQPPEDRYSLSKAQLLNQITMLYGGRAAEQIVFGDVSTGAHNDIQRATDIARRMVVEYGMSKAIGLVNYASDGNPWEAGWAGKASPDTARAIETEVRRMSDEAYARALEILNRHRPLLEEMSLRLLEKEVLEGDEMKSFLERVVPAGDLAELPTGEAYVKDRGNLMVVGGLQLGGEMIALLAIAFLGLLATVVAAIPLLRDRSVPGGVLLAGLGVVALAIPALGWAARPAAGMDVATARVALNTMGAIGILAPFVIGGVGTALAFALSIAASRAERWSWPAAACVLVAGLTAAGLEAAGGIASHNGTFAVVRAAMIAVGAVVAAGLALGTRDRGGAEGAAVGSVALLLFAAAVQRMLPGVAAILVQKPLLAVVPEARVAGIGRFLRPVAAEAPWEWAALAVLAFAAFGVVAFAGRLRPGAWSALPWALVAPLIALVGHPGLAELTVLATAR